MTLEGFTFVGKRGGDFLSAFVPGLATVGAIFGSAALGGGLAGRNVNSFSLDKRTYYQGSDGVYRSGVSGPDISPNSVERPGELSSVTPKETDPFGGISSPEAPATLDKASFSVRTQGIASAGSGSGLSFTSALNATQTALDVAGLVPGLGIVPDLINAGISLGRGNFADAGASAFAAIPLVGIAGTGFKYGRKALKAIKSGGKSFEQYKKAYWNVKDKIPLKALTNRETGEVWKQYTELHHRFIPQRVQKKYGLPNWLVNNKVNLQPMSSLKHAQRDPFRARLAPSWVKKMYNLKWK